MTPVINTKAEKITDRSTLDRKNFMFKFIKMRYSSKAEQSICYFISEKDRENIHKKLKEYDEINDACELLKEFKNTNEVHKFYEGAIEINKIQSFKYNEHR